VTRSVSHLGSGQGDRRFARRLSPLIAAVGVTAVPSLLLRYQGRLGLTSNEVIYVQHVMMHRWEEAWPWVAVSAIVKATGAAERSVRDWKASLVTKGFLTIRTRGEPGGGRGADEHDLSKLFAALEALALEEEVLRATNDARQQLPAPTYFRGMADVPSLGTHQRRKLHTERVKSHQSKAAENRRIEAAENRRANLPVPAAINLQVPAGEEEAVYKKPLTPQPPRGRGGASLDERTNGHQARLPRFAAVGLPGSGEPSDSREVWAFVVAFYGGNHLKRDAESLCDGERRQESRAAQRVLARGATSAEAQQFIGDMLKTPSRWAAPTVRLYDKEREAWLARRRGPESTAPLRSGYEHDPWKGRRPPIAEADLARGAAL
jgi:hypothetical protein